MSHKGASSGDKPIIHGSNSGKRALITLVLAYVNEHYSHILKVPMNEITQAIQKLGQTHEIRSYTNSYGNLKGALTKEDFSYILEFDGSVIKVVSLEKCEAAYKAQKITEADFKVCQIVYQKYTENNEAMKKMNPHLFQ